MADYDVLVIGGGPAGYSAALEAAKRGASVALVEAEQLGGACVHHACIPTNIMLGAVDAYVGAREFDVLGVFSAGDSFNFARAGARRLPLIHKLEEGIAAALKSRRVTRIFGRAQFASPTTITLVGEEKTISAEAFVIASGSRWETPTLPGLAAERLLTADQAQSLMMLPSSALVLGGGPAESAFAVEYAYLLAAAGVKVAFAAPTTQAVPGLDTDLDPLARAVLEDLGAEVLGETAFEAADGEKVTLRCGHEQRTVEAEIVLIPDPRRPAFDALKLELAGVRAQGAVAVDRFCRTNVDHIFAAGDVTGGAMITSAALQMGEVAGANAAGGEARTRLGALPHLLHTTPEIGWIGMTEAQARAQGYDVALSFADLSVNARAITLGAREGALKLVVDRGLSAVLGVHVVGPGAGEIVAVAATAMQAELTLDDLAALVPWHPSMAEALIEAARRAV